MFHCWGLTACLPDHIFLRACRAVRAVELQVSCPAFHSASGNATASASASGSGIFLRASGSSTVMCNSCNRDSEASRKASNKTCGSACFWNKVDRCLQRGILARSVLVVRARLVFLSGCILRAAQVDLFQAVVSLPVNKTAYETLQSIKDPQIKTEIYFVVGTSFLVAPTLQMLQLLLTWSCGKQITQHNTLHLQKLPKKWAASLGCRPNHYTFTQLYNIAYAYADSEISIGLRHI